MVAIKRVLFIVLTCQNGYQALQFDDCFYTSKEHQEV